MSELSPRTHTCGDLRAEHAGENVVLHGWAHNIRDKKTIFLILRDRYGTTQVTIDESCDPALAATMRSAALEYTIQVKGTVRLRDAAVINPDMDTGEIEVVPTEIEILSTTKPLPFNIDRGDVATEEVRLTYRYLDLRQQRLQRMLRIRHKAAIAVRIL